MIRTDWEIAVDGRVRYIQVGPFEVVVGSHAGSGHTDSACSRTHRAFLAGEFHDTIRADFGQGILEEVQAAVQAAPEHPPFAAQHAHVAAARAYLDGIPLDSGLAGFDRLPDVESGRDNYGSAGGYRMVVSSDTATLILERGQGIVQPNGGARLSYWLELPGHASAAVALRDHFYIVVSDCYAVVDRRGVTIAPQGQDAAIFGTALRVRNVYRHAETIAFAYWWFHRNQPDGLLRFQIGRGFTGRWEG
jgi:hypothetical protein